MGMTDQEIFEWVFDSTVSEYARLVRHIRYYRRYSTPQMEAIRQKAELVLYAAGDVRVVARMYHQAEKEHKQTQAQGEILGQNSYHLLHFKLDQYLDRKGGHTNGAGSQAG